MPVASSDVASPSSTPRGAVILQAMLALGHPNAVTLFGRLRLATHLDQESVRSELDREVVKR